jgi:hypothetical protein
MSLSAYGFQTLQPLKSVLKPDPTEGKTLNPWSDLPR